MRSRGMLRRERYDVILAANAAEARRNLTPEVDLVMLDALWDVL